MLPITTELAQRLELAEALDAADCAEAQCQLHPAADAAVKSVAGGVLAWLGPESPLTHIVGLGMAGPVTAAQLDEVEQFYRERNTAITLDLCPFADPTLTELVGARGYRITEFTNVMVRRLAADAAGSVEAAPGIEVRVAAEREAETWARTVVRGFFGRDAVSDEELRIGHILYRMPKTLGWMASIDGEPVGCAAMSIRSGLASCFADSTLVRFRRRGVHSALIDARLRHAAAAGCDLMTAGTQPGTGSQRDYERLGFQVAYTKVTMTL